MQGIDHGNPHFIEWEPQAQRGVAPCPRSYLLVKPLAVNNRSLDDAGEAGKGRGSWSHLVPRTPHTTGGLCRPVERGNLTSKGLLGTGDFPSTGVCVRSAPLPCSLLRSPGSGPAPLWPLQAVGQHMSALFMWVVPTPRLSFGFWFWLWGLLGGFWGHVTSTSVFVSGRRGAWKVVLTAKQPEPPHDSSEWEPLPHR